MDILIAPDVFVNASVARMSPPDRVVQKILGTAGSRNKTTPWILGRVEAMLLAHPHFKKDAVPLQLELLRKFLDVVNDGGTFGPDAWEQALLASAKATGTKRVVTDHPDLVEKGEVGDVEFVSCEAWLIEHSLPPPPPPVK